MTEAVLSRLPALAKATDAHTVTEDELKMIVEQGAEEGMLDRNEETMIKRVLQFGEITAQDLMTPRTKVVGINLDDPDSENVEKIFESSHSKFPVYRGSIDNLVGVLSVKKLFERLYRDGSIDIQACMTEPLFLPDSARADKVLDAMKQRSTHMAVLIDEFGGTAGVVTATDIVSAVMGEVPQDSVEHTPKFILRDDGSFLVDGMASLFELSERLELEIADLEDVGQTVSGLIMHLAKDIPIEGQKVSFKNWTFEVVDMDGNRIDKVLAHPIKEKEFKDSGVGHEDSDR
jgi:putative hemolysin